MRISKRSLDTVSSIMTILGLVTQLVGTLVNNKKTDMEMKEEIARQVAAMRAAESNLKRD